MHTTSDKPLDLVRAQGLVRPNDLAPQCIAGVGLMQAVPAGLYVTDGDPFPLRTSGGADRAGRTPRQR